MRDDYKNKLASKIVSRYQDLEERIMQDIVRRVVKAGEITSTADWHNLIVYSLFAVVYTT